MVYTINARDLVISHGNDPRYWKWYTDVPSGFEVAELVEVCWFDIRASVPARDLPRGSSYSTYLVFKLSAKPRGLEKATASVRFSEEKAKGTDNEGYTVSIDKSQDSKDPGIHPQPRSDGWKELNLGDFVNNRGRSSTVEARIFETSDTIWKSGIIIRGIEIRPN
ncbi:F-box protein At2g02240-like [Coffea arabica]|uniref:F-box protein At2g02240 n=1 Tax=Coffea arabica TaxID=13443 RepID=A0A6P6UXY0_COFAR